MPCPTRGIFRKGAAVAQPTTLRAQAHAQTKETMMRFYNRVHRFYCGVDLHARTLAVCILDQAGAVKWHPVTGC